MLTLTTHSPEETLRLGERLGRRLQAGDVILLRGELGAGKSVLARGMARGLGVQGPLPSPSFPVLLVHEGASLPLYHMDLYRLHDPDELYAMGLEEFLLGGQGVCLVEWPDRAPEAMPQRALEIALNYGPAENQRQVTFTPRGGFDLSALEDLP